MRNLSIKLTIAMILIAGNTVFSNICVIPRPNNIKTMNGSFVISPATEILYDCQEAKNVAQYLCDQLAVPMGSRLEVVSLNDKENTDGHILITTDGKPLKCDSESYELNVTPQSIAIKAQSRKGLFYGVQTFLQLMPADVFSKEKQDNVVWALPCIAITDSPVLPWRGYMLDVSRHFFSKETILRQIDLLALYKINVFHLHLTDDQGWRVEIKKYPRLTEVGAWRRKSKDSDEKYGGFYTQNDLREIVEYARQREVMIVPEIEMPGHSMAVIAAYPELSCRGESVEVRLEGGVSPYNLCPSNEKVYDFIADVFDEIVEIFPSPYIHIGGDEAQKGHWLQCPRCVEKAGAKVNPDRGSQDWDKIIALQPYFVGRVNDIIQRRDKTMIGWDEIADYDGLADLPGAVVQSWRSSYPGLKAAEKGHKVIMSPVTTFYLDYPNGRRNIERIYNTVIPDRSWRHYFDVENIMGVECPLWTESVSNQSTVDYMTWPRLLAMAELGWTDIDLRSYGEFQSRLKDNQDRLNRLGVNYQKLSGDKLACRWRPEDMPENEILEYDITGVIDKPGKWEILFVYEGGRKGLSTLGFEVVQNEEIIALCNRSQTLGWRDTWPVVTVDVNGLDLNTKQFLRIKLRRNPAEQGQALDSLGSVWFTYKKSK
jgi:hexosaminidase